jgi:hypothetical protein
MILLTGEARATRTERGTIMDDFEDIQAQHDEESDVERFDPNEEDDDEERDLDREQDYEPRGEDFYLDSSWEDRNELFEAEPMGGWDF